jgi:hypothetical protein
MPSASWLSAAPFLPDAYSVATRLPADVPTTRSGRMPFSSSTWMTPMCAKPRAAPPPRARPMRGGFGAGVGAITSGTGGVTTTATGGTATGGGATGAVVHAAARTSVAPVAAQRPVSLMERTSPKF